MEDQRLIRVLVNNKFLFAEVEHTVKGEKIFVKVMNFEISDYHNKNEYFEREELKEGEVFQVKICKVKKRGHLSFDVERSITSGQMKLIEKIEGEDYTDLTFEDVK